MKAISVSVAGMGDWGLGSTIFTLGTGVNHFYALTRLLLSSPKLVRPKQSRRECMRLQYNVSKIGSRRKKETFLSARPRS
jgi:hypothetical protein